MRAAVARNDVSGARREENLRQEISSLQVICNKSEWIFSPVLFRVATSITPVVPLRCIDHLVAALQEACRHAEARAQELSVSVAAATRPLLRQLDDMRAAGAEQQTSWEVWRARVFVEQCLRVSALTLQCIFLS